MKSPRAILSWCASAVLAAGLLVDAAPPTYAQSEPVVASPVLPLTQAAKRLGHKGIYFSLSYIENILANVSGGRQTGTLPNGELAFGAAFDLQKLVGIRGGSFHITLDERNGNSISRFAGSAFGLAANHGPNNVIRLSEFYYRQAFNHDHIDIKAGRTNPTLDFATSGISCEFVSNLFCAQPGIWYYINDNDPFPLSSWGGRVNLQLRDHVYFRFGGYMDDPSQVAGQGFTWRWDTGTGAFIPVELGYENGDTKYDIGGYYDTGTYTPPSPNVTRRDRSAVYAQAQQVVWKAGGASKQKVIAYAGALVQTGGYAPFWGEYYGGLFVDAPFPARRHDTLGFGVAYIPLSRGVSPYSQEYIFELNYGFRVARGVTVKPVMQYVINPDQIYFDPQRRVPNAFVIGAQIAINLGSALRFPQFVAY